MNWIAIIGARLPADTQEEAKIKALAVAALVQKQVEVDVEIGVFAEPVQEIEKSVELERNVSGEGKLVWRWRK